METQFWHQRWKNNEIGWHEDSGNGHLVSHFQHLIVGLTSQTRIFVPLCGMSADIAYFLKQQCQVVAIELNEQAVIQIFDSLGIKPQVHQRNSLKCYKAKNIEIFVGDFFSLSSIDIGHVNAVYDRASLVALPLEMRQRYSQHLIRISNYARQLLIVYDYQQELMSGPPFSVNMSEIEGHYEQFYQISLLNSRDVSGQLRGQFNALENAFLLEPKHNQTAV